jgi:hypothetical protein
MGKADLHIHTTYSYDGTATVAATLEHVVRNTDLDVIAITDHDQIDGALEATYLAARYDLEVVPGIEVSTAEGHLLALFVHRPVPMGLSLAETVLAVGEQGGLCVAAHPGGPWSWCITELTLRRALLTPGVAETLVGLERYNASLPDLSINDRAQAIHACIPLAAVANSDAHMLWMIGNAATYFPGLGSAALRTALRERTTAPLISPRPAHFIASYVKHQALRMVGLAHWSLPAPGSPIALRRLAADVK